MKKISLAFGLLIVLLLSGCANKSSKETAEAPFGAQMAVSQEETKAGGTISVGYIDFEFTVATEQNIDELNAEFDGRLKKTALSSSTQIALMMNNHRDDLTAFNYKELATLDGAAARGWWQVSERMGGHHVSGVLVFPKTENPKSLVITGLPVGDAVMAF